MVWPERFQGFDKSFILDFRQPCSQFGRQKPSNSIRFLVASFRRTPTDPPVPTPLALLAAISLILSCTNSKCDNKTGGGFLISCVCNTLSNNLHFSWRKHDTLRWGWDPFFPTTTRFNNAQQLRLTTTDYLTALAFWFVLDLVNVFTKCNCWRMVSPAKVFGIRLGLESKKAAEPYFYSGGGMWQQRVGPGEEARGSIRGIGRQALRILL